MAHQTTLPAAADQDPFQHLTVRNASAALYLEVFTQTGETIDGIVRDTNPLFIAPGSAVTYQSNGTTGWFRISAYNLPNQIFEANLANDWGFGATWTDIPNLLLTNTHTNGNYLATGYFPVDVSAGNNVNVGFAVRSVIDGVPGVELADWQDRASSVRLNISFAVPYPWDVNQEIKFQAQTQGSGTYTMLGSAGGQEFAGFEMTGPL